MEIEIVSIKYISPKVSVKQKKRIKKIKKIKKYKNKK